jgi:hypothetical protein
MLWLDISKPFRCIPRGLYITIPRRKNFSPFRSYNLERNLYPNWFVNKRKGRLRNIDKSSLLTALALELNEKSLWKQFGSDYASFENRDIRGDPFHSPYSILGQSSSFPDLVAHEYHSYVNCGY